MGAPELPVERLDGGRRYLEAIEDLGLAPIAAFWAFDCAISRFVLVLVADEYDHAGPLEVLKILFKAYNAKATPADLDPFDLRLHSPTQPIVDDIARGLGLSSGRTSRENCAATEAADLPGIIVTECGLEIARSWVYRFDGTRKTTPANEAIRRWHKFEGNIDRVAA